jgi:hypothetical protein
MSMKDNTENEQQIIPVIIVLGVVSILSAVIPLALAQTSSNNPGVFPVDSKPYGISYPDWTVRWWQWADSIPTPLNPASDKTGQNCAQSQSGPVWFLAGTFGGKAERTCTIPSGKAILFPPINTECSYKENPTLKTESDLRACAKHLQDETTQMQVTVDGVPIQNLQMYRVQTPLFNLTFPSNNAAGASPGTTQSVADGNWVFLKPLPPGKHELHFSGASVDFTSTGTNAFATDATYHITVQ